MLCHESVWWSGDTASPFFTSAFDGDEWSASRPGRFTLGEREPGTHWIGGVELMNILTHFTYICVCVCVWMGHPPNS
jgi:hypothetical protein